MIRRFLPVTLLLLALPVSAVAMQSSLWDFSGGSMPGQWQMKGWTGAQPTEQGIRINTAAEGSMARLTDFPHPVDIIQIRTSAPREVSGLLLWHEPGTPENNVYQLPLAFQAGSSTVNHVDLTIYPAWKRHPDLLGFAFPAGTDITVETMDFYGYNAFERMGNAWKSFWTFDTFNASAINFLWGPILRSAPVSRAALFDAPPPQGWSANRLFYGVLLIGGLLLWLWQWRSKRENARRRALLLFLALAGSLWLFYDVRMGAEFLSYAKWDYDTYFTRAPEEREFRRFENFYRAVDLSLPALTASSTYGFLCPPGFPFPSRVRYFTYPSIPVETDALPRPATWLVFRRNDVRVDGQGRLLEGDKVIAEGGGILQQFDETSFLYGTTP
ncbi:MAG: hypothetical protein WCV62_01255 [Candidatus Peribacteraceae bacterium]